jgi:hypothetical protein
VIFGCDGIAVYQSIDLNFVNYDNDNEKYVYVYAHTTRHTIDLVNEVERIAKENSGEHTGITIVSPDYWPLPWYFRNFTRVGYYGRMARRPSRSSSRMQTRRTRSIRTSGSFTSSAGLTWCDFELRPGVDLLLYSGAVA